MSLPKKMLAAVFKGNGELVLEERPVPKIEKPTDVLLEVEAAGICGTDLHILSVPPGHPAKENVILGHEYIARVVEVGPEVKSVKPGDRVVVDPNIVDWESCPWVKWGQYNICPVDTLGIFRDGGFAKYNVAPSSQLYKISDDVPVEYGALAEPLSTVVSAVTKLEFQVGETAVVLGAGPIGLLFIGLLKAAGASKIIAVELMDFRMRKALEMGANVVINPKEEDLEARVLEETWNMKADVVVDAFGAGFPQALKLVRPGGRIMLFGQNTKAHADIYQNEITRNEIKVLGNYIARFVFPRTVRIIESGVVNLKPIVTHKLKLSEIHRGIELMRSGEAVKVIIIPE